MNRIWLGLLALGALGALGATAERTGIRERLFGRQRFRFVYATGPMSPDEKEAASAPPWRLLSKDPGTGVQIQCALAQSTEPDAPWLVYFPGNDKTQLRTGIGVLASVSAAHPANLLVLSYRGYSGSSGQPCVEDIERDNETLMVSLMEEHRIRPDQLHIIGFSIGGYFASHFAAQLENARRAPASLVLFAPGFDLVMVRNSRFKRLDPGDDYQMAPFLGSVRSRSLVVQGGGDKTFDGPGLGRATAGMLADRDGSYLEVPEIGHAEILESAEAITRAREFIWR